MLGIFGGTFDPVHFGHIKPALEVKQALELSELRFIPNRTPPHREQPWLSSSQRLALLNAALMDESGCVIDERELDRDGPSYMVDTLASLKQDFHDQTLCLIIGMDAFLTLHQWYHWQQIFEYCHLVVTLRPGYQEQLIQNVENSLSDENREFLHQRIVRDKAALKQQANGKILLQTVQQLDISSTKIRKALANNEDVSQWLPVQVNLQLRGFINDNR